VSTRFDVLRTEVQLEDAQTELIAAENNVALARARLFEAIGRSDDSKPLVGALPKDFSRYHINEISLRQATLEDRVAQNLEAQAKEDLVKAANSRWMPRVSVFGGQDWYNNSNHSIFESDERFKTAYALGIQLKWNLFDGGAASATARQTEIAKRIAVEKLARMDQALPVDLQEANGHLIFNIASYKPKLSSIRKAEEAVRLAKGGVRAGIRTNTEVLDAVVDLNRAKAALVKSQVEAVEAIGQLELAIGHAL
jgi:outer membrane protein TolC